MPLMIHPVVSADMLRRHDRPGPRYTSYPTVPEWREDFEDTAHAAALAEAARTPGEPLSLYVHIPFCPRRCLYCGCNVIADAGPEAPEAYLLLLEQEIGMVADALGARNRVSQLHWGGGTPTSLKTHQMRRLHAMLAARFAFDEGAELAVETNPHSADPEQLACLRELGFNRISFGAQDLDPAVQAALGRGQNAEETARAVKRCRALGFKGLNLDLVYGLPRQTAAGWSATLDAVVAMRPDRVAIYSYAHLPQRFEHQRAIDALPRPDTREKYALFAKARDRLLESGYQAIGMDHFALPSDELALALQRGTLSRNFMGYTVVHAADQVGFGVSAISEVAGCYAQNLKEPDTYRARIASGRLATERGLRLSLDDLIRRWVIRSLMCMFEIDYAELQRRFGITFDAYFAAELAALKALREEGLLAPAPDRLRVTPLGTVFIRNLCMVFDAYLPRQQRLFSRTI